jgi:hypothetical protein
LLITRVGTWGSSGVVIIDGERPIQEVFGDIKKEIIK